MAATAPTTNSTAEPATMPIRTASERPVPDGRTGSGGNVTWSSCGIETSEWRDRSAQQKNHEAANRPVARMWPCFLRNL
jgi:hypothetical protein